MSQKKMRFGIGFAVILGAIGYFAVTGYDEGKAYYKTLDEMALLGPEEDGKRLRVAGFVKAGTIEREGIKLTFVLAQDEHEMAVNYVGTQSVPDTFKDGVDAVVEGYRHTDGTFEADHIQAKCASKYESEYGDTEKAETSSY
jgi:cytochrome c-type biogenesis protein CcmE